MIDFKLTTDYIELCDLLKTTGVCDTGGQAKIAVNSGLVKVDGRVETRKSCKIRPGQTVEFQSAAIYVMK